MSTHWNETVNPEPGESVAEEEAEKEQRDEERNQAAKESKSETNRDSLLRKLVQNDDSKLYFAMETFLLEDPASQIPVLGEPPTLIGKADQERAKGNSIIARVNYETAAKIAIYNQDREVTRKSLGLAQEVTNKDDKHLEIQSTMLDNLDEVMRVANEYYKTILKTID